MEKRKSNLFYGELRHLYMQIAILVCITALLAGSSNADDLKGPSMKTNRVFNSLSDFKKHLSDKLTAQEAVEIFGHPDKDLGSGLYIYQYPVKEGGTVTLSFSSYLLSARYMSNKGEQEELFQSAKNPLGSKQLGQKIAVHRSIDIPNGVISLDRIEFPQTNVPSNRPIYFLSISYIPIGTKNGDKKESFQFDPLDSGKIYQFGHARFRVLTVSGQADLLSIETVNGDQ